MSNPKFQHFLLRLRRSALFRSRSRLFVPVSVLLAVLFFSVSFVRSSSSSGNSPKTASGSPLHDISRSLGLAGNDELGLNGEYDKVTIEEGENDPSLGIEKRTINKGESIYTILTGAGLTPAEVQQLTSQLKGDKAVRGFRAGRSYEIEKTRNGNFMRFTWQASPSTVLHLVKDQQTGKLSVNRETIEFDTRVATLEGTLHTSLSNELSLRNRSSLGPQLKKILSSRVDFKKDIHAGATYRILYQEQWKGNRYVETSDILAVEIMSKGQKFNAYQFSDAKGYTAYYDEKGHALAQGNTTFIQPCRFNRVSSGFGYRIHPITGQREFHGGVDLVAPTGTPVRAVADGRIIFRGRENGTGNLVTIAHGNGLHTMYMHLSRYASTCRYGKAIKQGDIIGYVGSTGRSTGSHLDFRIVKNGHLQNPLTALHQKALLKTLSQADLRSFMARMERYHERLGGQTPVMVADAGRHADPML
jgi:murein DD-endopeptidase MepM/ murein hydrolase activator NlpD